MVLPIFPYSLETDQLHCDTVATLAQLVDISAIFRGKEL
jgi:hypothetical protein